MNLFCLDLDPKLCAQAHVNRHVVKMPLETTQMLNQALIKRLPGYVPVYRPTHPHQPVTQWSHASRGNFNWMRDLGIELCLEYTHRYGKRHKCQDILESFELLGRQAIFPQEARTPFALCIDDEFKGSNPVKSYRDFYRVKKAHLAEWKNRSRPEWWVASSFEEII